jgi:hypothetical protein
MNSKDFNLKFRKEIQTLNFVYRSTFFVHWFLRRFIFEGVFAGHTDFNGNSVSVISVPVLRFFLADLERLVINLHDEIARMNNSLPKKMRIPLKLPIYESYAKLKAKSEAKARRNSKVLVSFNHETSDGTGMND